MCYPVVEDERDPLFIFLTETSAFALRNYELGERERVKQLPARVRMATAPRPDPELRIGQILARS